MTAQAQISEGNSRPESPPPADRKHRVPPWLVLLVALAAAFLAAWILRRDDSIPRETSLMAGIFVLAAILWVTEALPLFATALLVIGLEALLLANPGGWRGLGFEARANPTYGDIFRTAADPVLVLFFGSFVLSAAAIKEGVDRAMSALLLRPFGAAPGRVLLGLMSITLLFGMWMSNTATASMMLAVIAPILAGLPPREPFRKALILGIPFASNIGGMSTPVASPPNAVAMGFLRESGQAVGFLQWMLVAVPLAILLTLVTWMMLWRVFRPVTPGLRVVTVSAKLTGRGWFVVGVFTLTVLLWMSERWHGLPPSVVALLPAILFTATGIFTRDDLGRLEWRILLLIAGGIALGSGTQLTGLDDLIVRWLPAGTTSGFALIGVLVLATMTVGTFMSNTAAANLFLPIGLSAVAALPGGVAHPVQVAMSIAFAASLSMALPISTPPNALAYASGEFSSREMARIAILVGGIAALLIVACGGWVMGLMGALN